MIGVARTGDLGLDVLLGGGWRLVERIAGQGSASVLVRGGAGSGKTLLGLQAALGIAEKQGGDVVVACVEILPTEYLAQLRSARTDIPSERVALLPDGNAVGPGPRLYCGLLPSEPDGGPPDLVAGLELLDQAAQAAGAKPVAFVVDSLIEGYGIGTTSERVAVDAVMKFAAARGLGLVLCEEATTRESPWAFAADTVLELGLEAAERGRWIEVRKHRFGRSAPGRHELHIPGHGPLAVYPQPHAWQAYRLHDVLRHHGWSFQTGQGQPPLVWHPDLAPHPRHPIGGALVLVTSAHSGVARTIAAILIPQVEGTRDLVFDLDPMLTSDDGYSGSRGRVRFLATANGPARALRAMIESFGETLRTDSDPVRRVLLGDLAIVLSGPDQLEWVRAVGVFASLVIESGWDVPVIVYDGRADDGAATQARSTLVKQADAFVNAGLVDGGAVGANVATRWTRAVDEVSLGRHVLRAPLPDDVALLDHLRMPGARWPHSTGD